MINHSVFLEYVHAYVKDYPEVAAYISNTVADGINESRREVLHRAADMEAALAVCIAARYKNRDALILSKLKQWEGKSAINWKSTIEMLEA
jgi:hypothetical protein